ncbi:MAG TPA: Ca2+-dependent phosphoinositide-specific phospholipase C, partial [Acidimicrobiales bacterium]|nr:Ca2+-dependent phosphoinositide-specific phospholipase C [Acidimicrobiales bacterium]
MARRGPRRIVPALPVVLALALLAAACRPPGPGVPGRGAGGDGAGHGPTVGLNEIQVLASHNSYHREPEPTLLSALKGFLGDAANGFEYTHRPLAEELDAGVRQVELDVFVDDSGGGRYAQPKLVPRLGLHPVDPALAGPG